MQTKEGFLGKRPINKFQYNSATPSQSTPVQSQSQATQSNIPNFGNAHDQNNGGTHLTPLKSYQASTSTMSFQNPMNGSINRSPLANNSTSNKFVNNNSTSNNPNASMTANSVSSSYANRISQSLNPATAPVRQSQQLHNQQRPPFNPTSNAGSANAGGVGVGVSSYSANALSSNFGAMNSMSHLPKSPLQQHQAQQQQSESAHPAQPVQTHSRLLQKSSFPSTIASQGSLNNTAKLSTLDTATAPTTLNRNVLLARQQQQAQQQQALNGGVENATGFVSQPNNPMNRVIQPPPSASLGSNSGNNSSGNSQLGGKLLVSQSNNFYNDTASIVQSNTNTAPQTPDVIALNDPQWGMNEFKAFHPDDLTTQMGTLTGTARNFTQPPSTANSTSNANQAVSNLHQSTSTTATTATTNVAAMNNAASTIASAPNANAMPVSANANNYNATSSSTNQQLSNVGTAANGGNYNSHASNVVSNATISTTVSHHHNQQQPPTGGRSDSPIHHNQQQQQQMQNNQHQYQQSSNHYHNQPPLQKQQLHVQPVVNTNPNSMPHHHQQQPQQQNFAPTYSAPPPHDGQVIDLSGPPINQPINSHRVSPSHTSNRFDRSEAILHNTNNNNLQQPQQQRNMQSTGHHHHYPEPQSHNVTNQFPQQQNMTVDYANDNNMISNHNTHMHGGGMEYQQQFQHNQSMLHATHHHRDASPPPMQHNNNPHHQQQQQQQHSLVRNNLANVSPTHNHNQQQQQQQHQLLNSSNLLNISLSNASMSSNASLMGSLLPSTASSTSHSLSMGSLPHIQHGATHVTGNVSNASNSSSSSSTVNGGVGGYSLDLIDSPAKRRIGDLAGQVLALQEELAQKDREMNRLENQRKDFHYDALKNKEELTALREQLEQQRQEWDRTSADLSRRHQGDMAEARATIESVKSQHAIVIADIQRRLDLKMKECLANEMSIEKLRSDSHHVSREKADLQRSLKELQRKKRVVPSVNLKSAEREHCFQSLLLELLAPKSPLFTIFHYARTSSPNVMAVEFPATKSECMEEEDSFLSKQRQHSLRLSQSFQQIVASQSYRFDSFLQPLTEFFVFLLNERKWLEANECCEILLLLVTKDCSLAQFLLPEEKLMLANSQDATSTSNKKHNSQSIIDKTVANNSSNNNDESKPTVEAVRDESSGTLAGNPRIKLKRKSDSPSPSTNAKKIAPSSSLHFTTSHSPTTTTTTPLSISTSNNAFISASSSVSVSRTLCRFLVDHLGEYLTASSGLLHCILNLFYVVISESTPSPNLSSNTPLPSVYEIFGDLLKRGSFFYLFRQHRSEEVMLRAVELLQLMINDSVFFARGSEYLIAAFPLNAPSISTNNNGNAVSIGLPNNGSPPAYAGPTNAKQQQSLEPNCLLEQLSSKYLYFTNLVDRKGRSETSEFGEKTLRSGPSSNSSSFSNSMIGKDTEKDNGSNKRKGSEPTAILSNSGNNSSLISGVRSAVTAPISSGGTSSATKKRKVGSDDKLIVVPLETPTIAVSAGKTKNRKSQSSKNEDEVDVEATMQVELPPPVNDQAKSQSSKDLSSSSSSKSSSSSALGSFVGAENVVVLRENRLRSCLAFVSMLDDFFIQLASNPNACAGWNRQQYVAKTIGIVYFLLDSLILFLGSSHAKCPEITLDLVCKIIISCTNLLVRCYQTIPLHSTVMCAKEEIHSVLTKLATKSVHVKLDPVAAVASYLLGKVMKILVLDKSLAGNANSK